MEQKDQSISKLEEAFKCFHKSASLGNIEAAVMVGMCLLRGEGCPEDPSKALVYFRSAAEQGHAEGQNQLATAILSATVMADGGVEGTQGFN